MEQDMKTAMVNRSLRAIRTELEFLTDASLITPQQMSSIVSQLPSQTELHTSWTTPSPTPPKNSQTSLPTRNAQNNSYNEKQNYNTGYNSPPPNTNQQVPAPPAYPVAPQPEQPVLAHAVALYQFSPTDAGDLALAPQERVAVLEYLNAEWWKGRSEKTGQEGIFPRNYVRLEGRAPPSVPVNNYGNMPLDISQSGDGQAQSHQPSKGAEMGKKFGRKLGNAAIFGAGATIGSDIVNSVF